MSMVVYKGEVFGENKEVEIFVKDISEIELGDKTENGYKIEPKERIEDGKTIATFDIPLSMIIGNAAIVGSDQQSFVIPNKEAPVDVELSKGVRAVFGDSQYRIVAQGFRVVCCSEEELKNIITPEDLYTAWTGIRAIGLGSYSRIVNIAPANNEQDIVAKITIQNKNFDNQTITLDFYSFYQTNVGSSKKIALNYIPKKYGICFRGVELNEAGTINIPNDYGCIQCIPTLVTYKENGEIETIPFKVYSEFLDGGSTDSSIYYLPFSNQAEFDFASGIINSYQYMTYEEYKEEIAKQMEE